MLPLTDAERQRVEENMALVSWVIRDCVHQFDHGVYDWDDLKQIGYIGLCKAVQSDRPGQGAFSTYAYIIIRNELYSALSMPPAGARSRPLIRQSCHTRNPVNLRSSRWRVGNC